MAETFGAAASLTVLVNQRTLEYDIFQGNEGFLAKAFIRLHSRSGKDWKRRIKGVPGEERALAFINLIKDKNTLKGDLAQQIAAQIEAGEEFVVPPYIREAIMLAGRP